ncbi:MAG: transglutaminase family protein, partial [Gemmatimonadales bacterium]
MDQYLRRSRFIDADHPKVVAYAAGTVEGATTAIEQAVALFYAVRDGVRYDPYRIRFDADHFRASAVLARGFAFCVPKAVLLAAAARAVGIPSRLRFADVHNHLATPRLRQLMGSDVFRFHGYAELYLDGRWIKATPAFNRSLCDRFDVPPLEFDGRRDALLQPFNRDGSRFLEYVHDHGDFDDLPFGLM